MLKNLNVWALSSLLVSIGVLIPILTVFISFFEETSNYYQILKDTFLLDYIFNSFILLICVLILTFIIGTASAYLVSFYKFPLSDFFKNKRVILFSLPGAFTPTCSSQQLPGFEKNADELKKLGIDEIYCCSVNDSYVMNAWAKKMSISNVKVIPDGSGLLTKYMGMLISKDHDGFGQRSWRYMAVINDGIVEKWWQEPGINNSGSDDDPYTETTPENTIKYLSASK